jgi:predicted pyridoxine 5'-phosphate oxidase superfamily flavin-nucleotide-binding protein
MGREFTKIAFTAAVKALQTRYGSRENYARLENGSANNTVTPAIAEFITARDSFYMGTVNSNGWPYIQFRGGSQGFLKVLDEYTLGFADFQGNLQYISTGNLSENDRVFLFLMDYAHKRRLKIWGRAAVVEGDLELLKQLVDPEYPAKVERAILVHIAGWDWNCPQHIPIRYSEAEVKAMLTPLQERITQLEGYLAMDSSGKECNL